LGFHLRKPASRLDGIGNLERSGPFHHCIATSLFYGDERFKIGEESAQRATIRRKSLQCVQRIALEFRGQPVAHQRCAGLLDAGPPDGGKRLKERAQAWNVDWPGVVAFEVDQLCDQRPVAEARQRIDMMHGLMPAIELPLDLLDHMGELFPAMAQIALLHARIGAQAGYLIADGLKDSVTVLIDVRHHHTAVLQSFLFQALAHNIDGCLLLAHDEGALSTADGIRDDVDNRLALAGARRPLQQQPGSMAGGEYGRLLRGIAGGAEEAIGLARGRGGRMLCRGIRNT
jgi:hypothetical protein